jgi:hypothetical protein
VRQIQIRALEEPAGSIEGTCVFSRFGSDAPHRSQTPILMKEGTLGLEDLHYALTEPGPERAGRGSTEEFLILPETFHFPGACLRLYEINLVHSTLKGNDPMTSPPAIPDPLYNALRDIIHNARTQAYRAVNLAMVEAYWNIGRLIVEEEQAGKSRAGYGTRLLEGLAQRLTGEFGRGFSQVNLRNFRQFYLVFPRGYCEGYIPIE